MYKSYWQLHAKPFEEGAEPPFYYPSEVHQGALLKLRYAVENRRGAALAAGATGLGKTTLLRMLERQLPEQFSPFLHVVYPLMNSRELVAYIADEMTQTPPTCGDRPVDYSVRRIQQFLWDNASQGRHAVVAVDEAQFVIDSSAIDALRLLLNIDYGSQPTLTLLLAGEPTVLPALDRMPLIEAQLAVKCLLRPFNADETVAYVTHRLNAAGARREIFTSEALNTLHHLTLGNPRRINRLCDLALLIGFAEEQPVIGSGQLEAVCHELLTVAPE